MNENRSQRPRALSLPHRSHCYSKTFGLPYVVLITESNVVGIRLLQQSRETTCGTKTVSARFDQLQT